MAQAAICSAFGEDATWRRSGPFVQVLQELAAAEALKALRPQGRLAAYYYAGQQYFNRAVQPDAPLTDLAAYYQTIQEDAANAFERYDFDNDSAFQQGLQTLLASPQAAANPQGEMLLAKLFYFNRFVARLDSDAYLQWVRAGRVGRPTFALEALPVSALAAIDQVVQTACALPPTPSTTAAAPAEGDDGAPARRLTMQEVMELVARGEPVPGVRKIPDQMYDGPPSAPSLPVRPKPWERESKAEATEAPQTSSTAAAAP